MLACVRVCVRTRASVDVGDSARTEEKDKTEEMEKKEEEEEEKK